MGMCIRTRGFLRASAGAAATFLAAYKLLSLIDIINWSAGIPVELFIIAASLGIGAAAVLPVKLLLAPGDYGWYSLSLIAITLLSLAAALVLFWWRQSALLLNVAFTIPSVLSCSVILHREKIRKYLKMPPAKPAD